MGESALLLAFEQRIDNTIHDRVLATTDLLRGLRLEGVLDIVPAYCSILVSFDPLRTSYQQITSSMSTLQPGVGDSIERPRNHHLVPVQYGGEAGPDLQALAASARLTPAEVVKLHSSLDYRVYFLGFMPGFAYMGPVPTSIAHPRHATPLPAVPAGSVGIAGEQTGVYPFPSPGGWQIIGRAAVQPWDPAGSTPALLSPGDVVRFEPSDRHIEPAVRVEMAPTPQNPVFEVIEPVLGSVVMDLGRPGYGHLGLSAGGVMDQPAARRANWLVGNDPNAAVLEMAHAGPTLRALRTTVIALEGADLHCTAGTRQVPLRTSWLVRAGEVLAFRGVPEDRGGLRGYLAVGGGLDVPPVLGSRSTYLSGGFGGLSGRAVTAGDILGAGEVDHVAGRAGRLWPVPVSAVSAGTQNLRYIPFEGPNSVPRAVRGSFEGQGWIVSDRSNRMGLRLRPDEAPLDTGGLPEALSFGVVRGAIQLPPDGYPFVLAADHQTTGGYPLLGVVIQADWPLVAQLAPGAKVRFEPTTLAEAVAALAQAERLLDLGKSPRKE